MGCSKNKFIETHAYLKKQEKSQINNLKEKEQTEPNKEINRNLKIQKRSIKPRAVPWKNKQNL